LKGSVVIVPFYRRFGRRPSGRAERRRKEGRVVVVVVFLFAFAFLMRTALTARVVVVAVVVVVVRLRRNGGDRSKSRRQNARFETFILFDRRRNPIREIGHFRRGRKRRNEWGSNGRKRKGP
jgi:membrane peptidoglycan carboxypeptidase